MTETDVLFMQDPRYLEALQLLQSGRWQEAIDALQALSQRYPDSRELETLLEQARLKASLDADWGGRIKGRRLAFLPRRVLFRLALALLLVGLVYVGFTFYRQWYLPRREQVAARAQERELQQQGQEALARGDFEAAQAAFSSVLDVSPNGPNDEAALAGLEEAERQAQLAADYEAALSVADAGDTAEAMALLRDLQARVPGYRDVSSRLSELESTQGQGQLFAQAEEHYAASRWAEASSAYEVLREQSFAYEQATVEAHLFESYLAYGQALVNAPPTGSQTIVEAQEAFQQALSLRPREPRATQEQELAYVYLLGLDYYEVGQWAEASAFLRSVYDRRPDYLGGFLAQQLYRAHLSIGDAHLALGEQMKAFEQYETASLLALDDVSEALLRMRGMAPGLTPTATATSTPTPTPTSTSTPGPAETPAPTPTPSPTPAPLPIWYYAGWIGFLSDSEDGTGLYVMRSDGSEVTRLDETDEPVYQELQQAQQRSPDGKARVYAEAEGGAGEATNLYIFRDDLPANWLRRRVLVDHGKHAYDPAWSPDGERIVFVSELTGNDEIWVINADGSGEMQLTYNDWQWDKFPTWSPDGSKIAFWSNRIAGHKQIWMMNADGGEQHNISNNEYNDWDPVWIRPDLISLVGEAIATAKAQRAAVQPTVAAPVEPTDTPVPTPTPTATGPKPSPSPTPTSTPVPPTPTPTSTLRPPTATPTPTRVPPTPTPTFFSRQPTATPRPTPTVSAWRRGRIVFRSDRNGQPALYIMDSDGSHPERVTDEAAYRELERREAFSPDGVQQLMVLDNAGNLDIYAVDGIHAQRQLTSNSSADYDPAWSPDGSLIVFVSERYGGGDIFVVKADGRDDRCLTTGDQTRERHPSWSPEGDKIVFWSDREVYRGQIWVMYADGSEQHNISHNEYNDWDPLWIK